MLAALADLSLTNCCWSPAMALVASIIGGVAGYGTGALMPLVLVPIVGAEPVVPIIAISALFTNTEPRVRVPPADRLAARRDHRGGGAIADLRLGAWGYTLLTGARRACW